MITIPKGTKDVLPSQSYKWRFIENQAKSVADTFCYKEIRTPVFEHTELFLRGVGDTTDVVNKEMYTFEDKGGRSITLKPEGTAGVARSFIENNLHAGILPVKMFYITPVFRYERPQAGRLREHHQFGAELYGAKTPEADADIISLAKTLFDRFNLKPVLEINSIGCPVCRKEYNNALKKYYDKYRDKICKTCKERLEKNPLRLLDCKEEICSEIAKNAPKILDYLCEDCREHHEKLKLILKNLNIDFVENPMIVRGLDYYFRTVFEFVSDKLGAKSTVCGGGRYNGLTKQLGGEDVPAVGFGMGIERLLLLIENSNPDIFEENFPTVFISVATDKAKEFALKTVYELRSIGIIAETDIMGRSLKAQMKYADKIKARYCVVLGDEELKTGLCKMKNMKSSDINEIKISDIIKFFAE